MSVIKRSNKWWVDFSYRGVRYRLPSPDNSKNGSKAYEAMLRQRISLGKNLIPDITFQIPKFKDFAKKWFKNYVEINNKPSAIKSKKTHLNGSLIPYFGNKRLLNITSLDIEEFKVKKLKTVTAKTINNQVGTLMKCLRTAVDWGIIDKVPITKPLKVAPSEFDFLSEEEANRLLQASTGPFYTAILLALHTGMRFGELMALDWKQINLANRQITVKQSFSNGILGSTKSNRIRYIPMTKDLFDHLLNLSSKEGYVLRRSNNKRFRPKYSIVVLHDICEKAKLRHIGWHKLRHTFASRLAEKGVPMVAVKELMGHSDIRTTMRYAHLGQHVLMEAISVLESQQKINICHNNVTIDNLGVSNFDSKNC